MWQYAQGALTYRGRGAQAAFGCSQCLKLSKNPWNWYRGLLSSPIHPQLSLWPDEVCAEPLAHELALTGVVPGLFQRILRRNGLHSSFCVHCEIAMRSMSFMVTSKRRMSWSHHGIGSIYQISHHLSNLHSSRKTILLTFTSTSTPPGDEPATWRLKGF